MKMTRLVLVPLLFLVLASLSVEAKDKPKRLQKGKKEIRMARLFKRKHYPSNSMLLPDASRDQLLLTPDKKSHRPTPVSGT